MLDPSENNTLIPEVTVAKELSFLGACRNARTTSPCRTRQIQTEAPTLTFLHRGGGKRHIYLSGEGNEDGEDDVLRPQDGFTKAHKEILVERNPAASSWRVGWVVRRKEKHLLSFR